MDIEILLLRAHYILVIGYREIKLELSKKLPTSWLASTEHLHTVFFQSTIFTCQSDLLICGTWVYCDQPHFRTIRRSPYGCMSLNPMIIWFWLGDVFWKKLSLAFCLMEAFPYDASISCLYRQPCPLGLGPGFEHAITRGKGLRGVQRWPNSN